MGDWFKTLSAILSGEEEKRKKANGFVANSL